MIVQEKPEAMGNLGVLVTFRNPFGCAQEQAQAEDVVPRHPG